MIYLIFSLFVCFILVVTLALFFNLNNVRNDKDSDQSRALYSKNQSSLTSFSSQSLNTQMSKLPVQSAPAINSSYSSLKNNVNKSSSTGTIPKSIKVAYLTFDDGPSNLTPKILDILKSKNVKATFFVIGKDDNQSKEILKRMVREGHAIGIHSWSHKYRDIYSNEGNFLNDFNKLRSYIYKVTGVQPNICRFPGGLNNTVCLKYGGHIMPKLYNDVTDMGIKPFDWNVMALDTSKVSTGKEQIIQNIITGSMKHSNAVILLHDTNRTVTTMQALPKIIDELLSRGFTFKTLTPSSPNVLFKPV
jgi:peptidoglycan/xylan/chitin deacetylase (PgdA/CDA1 family)